MKKRVSLLCLCYASECSRALQLQAWACEHQEMTAKTAPLLHRLSDEDAARRRAAYVATMGPHYRAANDEWLHSMFTLRGRALDRIAAPWLAVQSFSWLVTLLAELDSLHFAYFQAWSSAFTLVLTTLAFLLVFRLNRSAERFWQSRQGWGKLVELCRQAGCGVATHCAHAPELRDAACTWLCAFATTSKDLMRGTPVEPRSLDGLVPAEDVAAAAATGHPPLFCASGIRAAVAAALGPGRSDSVAVACHRAACLTVLNNRIDELVGCVGAMERIKATPLPFVYVAHLRTFLLIYLSAMPLIFVSSWGWATPGLMAFVAYALLGVEGAGAECECPFSAQRVNHLAMEVYAAGAIAGVAEVLRAAEAHAAAPWAGGGGAGECYVAMPE